MVKGDSNCKLCGLQAASNLTCLMGRGPVPCKVMAIGEAPGKREDRPDVGKPFSGAAGRELDEKLLAVGIRREDVYVTNVVHCRPPDNRRPTRGEITKCLGWLQKELKEVQPSFILLLGGTALKAFPEINAKGSITEIRGQFFTVKLGGREVQIMPTFHPASTFYDERKGPLVAEDIKKFAATVNGETLEKRSVNVKIADSISKVKRMVADLESEKVISLDIETTSLFPWKDEEKIICLGLGLRTSQWLIPLNHRDYNFSKEYQQSVLELVQKVLSSKILIGQDGKFDSLWLKVKYGLEFTMSHCTMLLSSLLDENSPHSLKYLSSLYFGADDYDISIKEKTGGAAFKVIAKYCGKDVYYTRKLYFKLIHEIKKDPKLFRLYKLLVMPIARMYRDVEINGIYINVSKMDEVDEALQKEIKDLKKKLDKYGPEVNWNSYTQLGRVLFEDLRLPVLDLTATDEPSTAESVLKRLSKKHPLPGLVLKYRESNGLRSKFITSWKGRLVNECYLHPSYKINGTVTGRPSCEEPNLQQTPRDSKIRSLIIAPPGWSQVDCDAGQAELRIAACLSGDRAMKLIFQTGQDIHAMTAELISHLKLSEMTKEAIKSWRKKAKPVNFGFLYGMGVETFLEYARDKFDTIFTYSEGRDFRDAFFRKFRGLPTWYDRQHRIAKLNGYVRSLSGRVRHLPDIYSPNKGLQGNAERQSVNSPVQGFVADFLLMGCVEVHKKFSHDIVRIVGTVHDSALMIVKNEYLEKILPEIKKIMESPELLKDFEISLTVPMVMEFSIGPWGSGEVWEGIA